MKTHARPRRLPGALPRSVLISLTAHAGLLGGGIALGLLVAGPEPRSAKVFTTGFVLAAAPEEAPRETLEPLETPTEAPEPELRESEVWAEPDPFPALEDEPLLPPEPRVGEWVPERPMAIGTLERPLERPAEPAHEPVEESVEPPALAAAPPESPTPASPPVVSEVVPLHVPAPIYPRLARRAGEEGSVLCRLELDAEGLVAAVEIVESSGHARLDEATREALLTWRFQPRREDGRAVPTQFLHRVTFRLSSG